MHLTAAELFDLTGRVRPGAQVAWLRRNRWRFALDSDGRPRVYRAYYDRRMLGEQAQEPGPRPDFEAIRG